MTASLAADVILIVHFAFVLFVTGGLLAIWVGALSGWACVRNRTFRLLHLAAICFVAAEALAGVVCPLTALEDALRGRTSEIGLIPRAVRSVLYYDLPEWVFTIAYLGFAGLVVGTLWFVPPAPKQKGA